MFAFSTAASATTVTLIGSSPSYPGSVGTGSGFYPASDAVDTGAGHLVSDYASNGVGVGTFLDFSITGGSASGISLYDRTTSGGGNNAFHGGTTDFTTAFELIFSNNADFSLACDHAPLHEGGPDQSDKPGRLLFLIDFCAGRRCLCAL